ncbi:hypothetical protein FEM48_Zijuj05G0095400 [Ziziphus jujuba var. spinosa]|uniref:Protein kinase domain-containing protein n=1 Tax=Ziziphus jujuba var. spinosa TaxID=714518 RepID=A0A978VE68_ZIZJJ|nr:hypothetical protein FEM48_Zijuj05G0095400 [Ziziphus jujuba var. spinosa]
MTIARSDLSDNPCSAKFDTLSSNTLFDYAPTVYNLTLLYGCQLNPLDDFDADQYNFTCGNDKFGSEAGKFDVPAALKQGFEVEFKYNRSICKGCEQSDGKCGSNTTTNQFVCYCPKKESNGVFFPHGGAVAVALMYKFFQIKKMTNNNSHEVGRGAFGVVCKGKLQDGSDVVVKILTEPKENGDKENSDVFINEVASISKTAHVNVIKLLELCLQRCRRALIYEYMPKGSLEKFIFINRSKTTRDLAWEKLLQIAIEIA